MNKIWKEQLPLKQQAVEFGFAVLVVLIFLFVISGSITAEEQIDLTKEESLELIVLRDQVEEAARAYSNAQQKWQETLSKVFKNHGLELDEETAKNWAIDFVNGRLVRRAGGEPSNDLERR